jgi:class 3 adenylate cyclase
MHQRFKELLKEARGESHLVLVVSVDVRSFSTFSLAVESVEAAIYIKKIYERIVNDYFPTASFFKPTGDGLLLVFHFEEATLKDQANELVHQSRRLVADFATLLEGDLVINFAVPDRVGIGIARGAASALVADETILEYSGRVLNMAARLTELARPEGVVIADSLGIGLLEPALGDELTADEVYVRSVAEEATMLVHYDSERTAIPPRNRRPFKDPTWERVEEKHLLRELRERLPQYAIALPSAPLDREHVRVEVLLPKAAADGSRHESLGALAGIEGFTLNELPGRCLVQLDMGAIVALVMAEGADEDWPVNISVSYLPA